DAAEPPAFSSKLTSYLAFSGHFDGGNPPCAIIAGWRIALQRVSPIRIFARSSHDKQSYHRRRRNDPLQQTRRKRELRSDGCRSGTRSLGGFGPVLREGPAGLCR